MFWTKKSGVHKAVKIDPELLPYYEIAGMEIAAKQCHQGLLAQAFAECDGNAERTHARYIELRVQFLKLEAEHRRAVEMENERNKVRHEEFARNQREVEKAEARIKAEMAKPENQEKGGMLVTSVDPRGDGINEGDVIVMYNGIDVRRNKRLFCEVQEKTIGIPKVNVVLIRDKQIINVRVNGGSLGVGFAQLAG